MKQLVWDTINLIVHYRIVKTHKEAKDLINVHKGVCAYTLQYFSCGFIWSILKCVSMVVVPLVLYQIESIVESIDALICGKGDRLPLWDGNATWNIFISLVCELGMLRGAKGKNINLNQVICTKSRIIRKHLVNCHAFAYVFLQCSDTVMQGS